MAFTLPDFNLSCNIFTGGAWPPGPPRVVVDGNLANGRRIQPGSGGLLESGGAVSSGAQLLLPALTDVRDAANNDVPDFIECPAGTGRFYFVIYVDDVGKGFSNEHRIVGMVKLCQLLDPSEFAGVWWPTPIP